MSRRQHRRGALIAFSVMFSMFALVVALTEKVPKTAPKQVCHCPEGLQPVTYETPTGHERKCMSPDQFAEVKVRECRFDKEKGQ